MNLEKNIDKLSGVMDGIASSAFNVEGIIESVLDILFKKSDDKEIHDVYRALMGAKEYLHVSISDPLFCLGNGADGARDIVKKGNSEHIKDYSL